MFPSNLSMLLQSVSSYLSTFRLLFVIWRTLIPGGGHFSWSYNMCDHKNTIKGYIFQLKAQYCAILWKGYEIRHFAYEKGLFSDRPKQRINTCSGIFKSKWLAYKIEIQVLSLFTYFRGKCRYNFFAPNCWITMRLRSSMQVCVFSLEAASAILKYFICVLLSKGVEKVWLKHI